MHEAALLTSVRASFHVYLVSKGDDVKEASKKALGGMLERVFGRMEEEERRINEGTICTSSYVIGPEDGQVRGEEKARR